MSESRSDPDADTDPDMLPVRDGDTAPIPVVRAPVRDERYTVPVRIKYLVLFVVVATSVAAILYTFARPDERTNYPYGGVR